MPRGPQRQPIDPNLPPDTPLEPGSGAPRIKPGSAAARIAASEAALGNSRPMAPESGGKSAAIAAARNAMDTAEFERMWEQGRRLTVEQAVAAAQTAASACLVGGFPTTTEGVP